MRSNSLLKQSRPQIWDSRTQEHAVGPSLSGLWLHVDAVSCYMSLATNTGTTTFNVCFRAVGFRVWGFGFAAKECSGRPKLAPCFAE